MKRSPILAAAVLATLVGASASQADTVLNNGSAAATRLHEEQSRQAVADGRFGDVSQTQYGVRATDRSNQSFASSYGYPVASQNTAQAAPEATGTYGGLVPGSSYDD